MVGLIRLQAAQRCTDRNGRIATSGRWRDIDAVAIADRQSVVEDRRGCCPFGLTVPPSVAPVLLTLVGAPVITPGAVAAVVKVKSAPLDVPSEFVATRR